LIRGIRASGDRLASTKQFLSLHYVAVPAQPWAALERQWAARLAPKWRERLAARKAAEDLNASLLGLALLERACLRLGQGFAPRSLVASPRGRPELPGGPSFSIAHAGGLVACACASEAPVGLDLEPVGAVAPAMLRLALGARELAQVARGDLDATAAWVMTEAVVKAAGEGIGAAGRVRLEGPAATLDGTVLALTRVDLGPKHIAYLAHRPVLAPVEVVRHELAEFATLP
jgi:4'-phosphopantetheinyl transferase